MTVAKKAAKQVLVLASKAKPETKLVDLKLVTKDHFYPYRAQTETGSNGAFEKKHGLVTVADLCKVEREDIYDDSDHSKLYIAAAKAAKVPFKPEAVSRYVEIDGALYAEISEAAKALAAAEALEGAVLNPEANTVEPAAVHYEITTNGLRGEPSNYNGSFPDGAAALRRISVVPYASRFVLGIVRVTQLAPEEKRIELKENDFCGATHFAIKRRDNERFPFVQTLIANSSSFYFGTLAEAKLYDSVTAAVRDLEVRASDIMFSGKTPRTIVGVKVERTAQEKVEVII